MKQTFKFLIGLAIGFLIAYWVRRLLVGANQPIAPEIVSKNNSPVTHENNSLSVPFTTPQPEQSGQAGTTPLPARDTASETVAVNAEQAPAIVETSDSIRADDAVTDGEQAVDNSATAETFDFLIINDIGPISNKRLLDAGVTSFAALAAMPIDDIARITKLPAARIVQNRWREQSARLAEGLPLEEEEVSSEENRG